MKLINLQIKNYKSIDDSKVCFLEKDLTIFAGKNESGKSSILEALNDFNYGQKINPESKQINNEKASPEIILTFEMQYFLSIGVEKKISKDFMFKLTNTNDEDYIFDDEAESYFEFKFKEIEKKENLLKKLDDSYNILKELYDNKISSHLDDFFELDIKNFKFKEINQQIQEYKSSVLKYVEDQLTSDEKEIQTTNIQIFEEAMHEFSKLPTDDVSFRKSKLLNLIPNFILFKSFEDDIPNKVAFTDLQKNEFIKDLEIISNFNKSILTSGNDRKQSDHKEKVNIEFNKEYKEFWTQDDTTFEFDWHDKNLLVWIKENGERYKPTERSKGKQWHLSFYIRVSARSSENKANIIMIDEPGMYLHAKAQSDIYNKLLKISKKSQVIFTTHSPYLLRYDEIDRIRLVNKYKSKSWINQKVHIGADKETLTPLLTAIGLELNTEIHAIDKLNNVVVEGPSDFYYLQSIKIIKGIEEFNFIFGGGSTKMPFVGAILMGWGTSVLYLFDDDSGRKQGEKTLINDWLVEEDDIKCIIDQKGSVEDIWSKSFFKEHILLDNSIMYEESNSTYVKKHSMDKVLLSKLFLTKVRNNKIILDDETKRNIDGLINKISVYFRK